jgi:hypothetical protein
MCFDFAVQPLTQCSARFDRGDQRGTAMEGLFVEPAEEGDPDLEYFLKG